MIKAEYCNNDTQTCRLCPHNCRISSGKSGICGVRKNENDVIVSLNFNVISSLAVDPIEKKPLYHFYPGTAILSAGSIGCNLKCPYCQNWHISQKTSANSRNITPNELIQSAFEEKISLLAYTYSEPVVWYEYVRASAILAHENGIKNVMVTNGMINHAPLEELHPHIDAWNIDLKTSSADVFRKVHKGDLDCVKSSIEWLSPRSHIELTALIVTGINDNEDDFHGIVDFISSLRTDIPLHISRYFPAYNYNAPATDLTLMRRFFDIAKQKLEYVYCGNVADQSYSQTYCPGCGEMLVRRNHYNTEIISLQNGKCLKCGKQIYGVFSG